MPKIKVRIQVTELVTYDQTVEVDEAEVRAVLCAAHPDCRSGFAAGNIDFCAPAYIDQRDVQIDIVEEAP